MGWLETNCSVVLMILVCKMEGGLCVGKDSKVILNGKGKIVKVVTPVVFLMDSTIWVKK